MACPIYAIQLLIEALEIHDSICDNVSAAAAILGSTSAASNPATSIPRESGYIANIG